VLDCHFYLAKKSNFRGQICHNLVDFLIIWQRLTFLGRRVECVSHPAEWSVSKLLLENHTQWTVYLQSEFIDMQTLYSFSFSFDIFSKCLASPFEHKPVIEIDIVAAFCLRWNSDRLQCSVFNIVTFSVLHETTLPVVEFWGKCPLNVINHRLDPFVHDSACYEPLCVKIHHGSLWEWMSRDYRPTRHKKGHFGGGAVPREFIASVLFMKWQ